MNRYGTPCTILGWDGSTTPVDRVDVAIGQKLPCRQDNIDDRLAKDDDEICIVRASLGQKRMVDCARGVSGEYVEKATGDEDSKHGTESSYKNDIDAPRTAPDPVDTASDS